MVVGNIDEATAIVERRIRGERRVAAAPDPALERLFAVASVQHHHFVIATQRDKGSALFPIDEPIEDGVGFGAAIDVVAEGDEDIVGKEWYERRECGQRLETAVDVADREVTFHDDRFTSW